MPLIQCSECGRMVSDRATECPHCGCPIDVRMVTSPDPVVIKNQKGSAPKWQYAIIAALSFAVVVVSVLLIFGKSKPEGADSTAAAATSAGEPEKEKTYALSTAELGWLNVRQAPSTTSKVVAKMRTCVDVAEVLGKEDDWYKVRFDGVVGYLRGDFTYVGNKEKIEEYQNVLRMPTYKQIKAMKEWAPSGRDTRLYEGDLSPLADFIPGMKFLKCNIDYDYGPYDAGCISNGDGVNSNYVSCYGMNITDVRMIDSRNVKFLTNESRACGVVVYSWYGGVEEASSVDVYFKDKVDADTFHRQMRSTEKLVKRYDEVDEYESGVGISVVKKKGDWYVVIIEDFWSLILRDGEL